jgi:hypothetical protein
MNLQHTKLRSALTISRVDKLVYIYMNTRALRNQDNNEDDKEDPEELEWQFQAIEADEIDRNLWFQEYLGETPLPRVNEDPREISSSKDMAIASTREVLGKRPCP